MPLPILTKASTRGLTELFQSYKWRIIKVEQKKQNRASVREPVETDRKALQCKGPIGIGLEEVLVHLCPVKEKGIIPLAKR